MNKKIADFISILKQSPLMKNVFNPWRDVDAENDIDSKAPEVRTAQLIHYLKSRIHKARYILIGEAIGYQGGHFSGIAMTSERILLGHKKEEGICPGHVLFDLEPQRTSKPATIPKGFSEPTATIVWGTLLRHRINSEEFVIWNVFPWHPFDPEKGLLSNRRPTEKELKYAHLPLKKFLEIFPDRIIIAVGKTSYRLLKSMNIDCFEVRHPANGGASKFRKQICAILNKKAV